MSSPSKGRFFEEHDRDGAPNVAIVNEAFARKFFPNEDPIGREVTVIAQTEDRPANIQVALEAVRWRLLKGTEMPQSERYFYAAGTLQQLGNRFGNSKEPEITCGSSSESGKES